MERQFFKIFFLLVVVLMPPNFARAGVVFQTTFDDIANFSTVGDCGTWSGGVSQCGSAPAGFSNYYTPSGGSIGPIPGGLADHTGGTAKKAWMAYYPNAVYSGGSFLSKTLNTDYPELYARFYMRVDPNWYQATTGQGDSTAGSKVIRIDHFDRTGEAFQYFSGGYGAPIADMNLSANNTYYPNRALYTPAYRGDPQASFYQSIPGTYTDAIFGMPARDRHTDFPMYMSASGAYNAAGNWGDGAWHKYDFHVKMNTHSGNTWNADGVWQIWYDGVLVFNDTGIQWTAAGSDGYTGWNTIQMGGNANNPGGSFTSQWIAYDDLVVSTTAIPADYVIGASSDTTPPAAPTGLIVR